MKKIWGQKANDEMLGNLSLLKEDPLLQTKGFLSTLIYVFNQKIYVFKRVFLSCRILSCILTNKTFIFYLYACFSQLILSRKDKEVYLQHRNQINS